MTPDPTRPAGLEHIDLDDSYIRSVEATAQTVSLRLDFALSAGHTLYQPPPRHSTETPTAAGGIVFTGITRLVWDRQQPPASDATGSIDHGVLHTLTRTGDTYHLGGADLGTLDIHTCEPVTVYLDQDTASSPEPGQ